MYAHTTTVFFTFEHTYATVSAGACFTTVLVFPSAAREGIVDSC